MKPEDALNRLVDLVLKYKPQEKSKNRKLKNKQKPSSKSRIAPALRSKRRG